MEYEKAKELKDAGFPQKVREDHQPELVKQLLENDVYLPDLEELIDACGEGDFKLTRTKMWHASIVQGDRTEHDWEHEATPLEAVANLYLALNKK